MNKPVESYICHTGDHLWDFEIVAPAEVENLNHIHPLKQQDVGCLVESVKHDKHIVALIVFGSAVRFDCHSMSDVDILVVRDDGELRIDASLDGIKSEMDIIFNSHLGKRLEDEIANTGVIVYRRELDV